MEVLHLKQVNMQCLYGRYIYLVYLNCLEKYSFKNKPCFNNIHEIYFKVYSVDGMMFAVCQNRNKARVKNEKKNFSEIRSRDP